MTLRDLVAVESGKGSSITLAQKDGLTMTQEICRLRNGKEQE